MPEPNDILKPYRRFRIAAVRYSLILVALFTLGAFPLDRVAAQGVLLGGIAGVLGFWIIAIRLEKLANMGPGKVKFAALTWSFFRFALYGAALYRAYTLDPETKYGLLGALVGIFANRFVIVFMGVTGIDMPSLPPANDPGEQGDRPDGEGPDA